LWLLRLGFHVPSQEAVAAAATMAAAQAEQIAREAAASARMREEDALLAQQLAAEEAYTARVLAGDTCAPCTLLFRSLHKDFTVSHHPL
jgi:hypothetical protein